MIYIYYSILCSCKESYLVFGIHTVRALKLFAYCMRYAACDRTWLACRALLVLRSMVSRKARLTFTNTIHSFIYYYHFSGRKGSRVPRCIEAIRSNVPYFTLLSFIFHWKLLNISDRICMKCLLVNLLH